MQVVVAFSAALFKVVQVYLKSFSPFSSDEALKRASGVVIASVNGVGVVLAVNEVGRSVPQVSIVKDATVPTSAKFLKNNF